MNDKIETSARTFFTVFIFGIVSLLSVDEKSLPRISRITANFPSFFVKIREIRGKKVQEYLSTLKGGTIPFLTIP